MKKILMIGIVVVIIFVGIYSVIYYNEWKVLEVSSYETGHFSIERSKDKIIHTLYYPIGYNPIKIIDYYDLVDGVVVGTTKVMHYDSIGLAKSVLKKGSKGAILTRNKNIITVKFNESDRITADEAIENIRKNSSIYKEIKK